ncbi:MAG: hypothetical protein GWP09_02720 [Nitrospiraceae bacterium]|nr:hypothetical protein [Nitrospiraceae bacterium]
MDWKHYNNLRSSFKYIENLLIDTDVTLSVKNKAVFQPVKLDLSEKQVYTIKKDINKFFEVMKKAKHSFNIESTPISASRILKVNLSFIWKTIEDSWSSKIEKTTGSFKSDEEKEKLDAVLHEAMMLVNDMHHQIEQKDEK